MIESEVSLDDLFDMGNGFVEEETDVLEISHKVEVYDEEFAYHRTISRLREMQTQEYQELSLSATKTKTEKSDWMTEWKINSLFFYNYLFNQFYQALKN